jgi:RNA polymerase sigma-70 factor, ECF subfamily
MKERSDAQIIRAVLDGEQTAYAALVARYQERLFRRALGLTGDPDMAADMVQDAFVRAYSALDRAQPQRFGAWIHRILRNLCLDELRSPRQREAPLTNHASSPADPAHDLEQRELGDAIDSALASLSPTIREAFVMKHVEGLSYREMVELTGAGDAALKMRVNRARAALRSALQPINEERMM